MSCNLNLLTKALTTHRTLMRLEFIMNSGYMALQMGGAGKRLSAVSTRGSDVVSVTGLRTDGMLSFRIGRRIEALVI